MDFSPVSLGTLTLLIYLSLFSNPVTSQLLSDKSGFISAHISEKGLMFVKDLLVEQAIRSLILLRLPDIEKSVKIPLIGGVHMSASNIVFHNISVSSSTIRPADSDLLIVVSGANASLTLKWSYMYSTWFVIPIEVFDEGSASVQVEGLEVSLALSLENKNGNLVLNLTRCSCYIEDIKIVLDGGASWFYQGFVIVLKSDIMSNVESAIMKEIWKGLGKLGSLLLTLPKQIDVGNIATLNVTFVDGPVVQNSSIEFNINGLFIRSPRPLLGSYLHKQLHPSLYQVNCGDVKMLAIFLEEAVFNSAFLVLFEEGLLHWVVDKVPDQSLLNTASWKFIIPQLYREYPNDDMLLNILLPSAPVIKITQKGFVTTILSDMTVEVLEGSETIPVACISVDFTISGAAEISGNKLISKARLNDFTLSLKWSKIGNFKMFLIQGVMRVFLNTVVMPYVNFHLHKGLPIPVLHGFTLQNAQIIATGSAMALYSDVALRAPVASKDGTEI